MIAASCSRRRRGPDAENDPLESRLRQLASLNWGRSINPRSPRQVSDLLYGGDFDDRRPLPPSPYGGGKDDGRSAVAAPRSLGPTDRATLRRIALDDGDASADGYDGDEAEKRRRAAALVLQCRELLRSATSHNARAASPSIASRAAGGRMTAEGGSTRNDGGDLPPSLGAVQPLSKRRTSVQRVANFSNVASSQFSDEGDGAIVNGLEKERNGDVREEEVASSVGDGDPIAASAVPSSAAFSSMSPYERMVMDLFPDVDNSVGSNLDDDAAMKGDLQRPDAKGIDPYWMEPLLSLTKSSARSLVRQLQSASCPMGYDPSASPINSLISTGANKAATPVVKRTTSLLSYVRDQKYALRDVVALVRVGDFYESYGVDAILLAEHCGLNPMAGKARAGCPWRNVQATLDGLTGAGYRVAVYEEWNGAEEDMPGGGAGVGGGKGGSKLKARYLAQVVSSVNPTYMHGLVLNDDGGGVADDSPARGDDASASSPGRSYVGVIETRAGHTLVEVSAEERTAVVSERLTAEAVSCRLVAYPPADPLFYVPPGSDEVTAAGALKRRRSDRLPFLPWRQPPSSSLPLAAARGYSRGGDFGTMKGRKVRVRTLPPALVVGPRPGLTDVERAKQTVVEAFLRLEDDRSASSRLSSEEGLTSSSSRDGERGRAAAVTHHDFVVVASSSSSPSPSPSGSRSEGNDTTITRPLHLETATQLGLLSDPAIPPLVSHLLPDSAPSASRRFLRRWLLVPPPPDVADAMSLLVESLKDDGRALPVSSVNAPSLTGKVVCLIRAGQASAAVYCEILAALDAAGEALLLDGADDEGVSRSGEIVAPLMRVLRHDTGIADTSDSGSLRRRFLDAMRVIGSVVSTHNLERTLSNADRDDDPSKRRDDFISYFGDVVPPAFYERNDAIWRGRVRPDALECARSVPLAARRLAEAVAVDFWGAADVLDRMASST